MKISINTAEKCDILLLPGINLSEAEAIIQERDRIFGFSSREDFMDYVVKLGVQPHFYKQIENSIDVQTVVSNSARFIDF